MTRSMRALLSPLAALFLALPSLSQGSANPMVQLGFREPEWRRGDVASIQFTTSGFKEDRKAAAFLYQSFLPTPLETAEFPPLLAGEMNVPGIGIFPAFLQPDRNPITESTRERFFQGVLLDTETGEILGVSNVAYLSIDYEAPDTSYRIDFETDDDFVTPLFDGQAVSTPGEFGRLFALSSSGPGHFGSAIFDSSPFGPNQFSQDRDLLVGQGNVLILQSNRTMSTPGFFDIPNDYAGGGTQVFDFGVLGLTRQVEPVSIDLIDLEIQSGSAAEIVLIDVLGARRTYQIPAGWTGNLELEQTGVGTLDLTTTDPQPGFLATATATEEEGYIRDEISRMTVRLTGSGAVDNFEFRREADPQEEVPSLRRSRRPAGSLPLR